ncbi:hypothetical protein GCM10010971_29010 [Silvimonas amylolytica]|uniref:Uncharacterized protein n=1 Tax=Silvimonas amylolytica TaxID=449663 RepID=A0ABQ2PQ18_9NEIS|nr:hypothetical protein GCM10010971_29010 [Silvimonas amylolytica]
MVFTSLQAAKQGGPEGTLTADGECAGLASYVALMVLPSMLIESPSYFFVDQSQATHPLERRSAMPVPERRHTALARQENSIAYRS